MGQKVSGVSFGKVQHSWGVLGGEQEQETTVGHRQHHGEGQGLKNLWLGVLSSAEGRQQCCSSSPEKKASFSV